MAPPNRRSIHRSNPPKLLHRMDAGWLYFCYFAWRLALLLKHFGFGIILLILILLFWLLVCRGLLAEIFGVYVYCLTTTGTISSKISTKCRYIIGEKQPQNSFISIWNPTLDFGCELQRPETFLVFWGVAMCFQCDLNYPQTIRPVSY